MSRPNRGSGDVLIVLCRNKSLLVQDNYAYYYSDKGIWAVYLGPIAPHRVRETISMRTEYRKMATL